MFLPLLVLCLGVLAGCGQGNRAVMPEEPSVLRMAAAGDVMVHQRQLVQAHDPGTRSFDFTDSLLPLAPLLEGSDIAWANLETTFGAALHPGSAPREGFFLGYGTYPLFSAPDALGDALAACGFTHLSTANNHSLDLGAEGLLRTTRILRERGIVPVGTGDATDPPGRMVLVEEAGWKVGLFAYTYGTNLPPPPWKASLVNSLQGLEPDAVGGMLAAVGAAREEVDLLAVYLHLGEEHMPRADSDTQERLARALSLAGADLVLMSHAHVVQPMEWIPKAPGSRGLPKTLAAYSLGNLLSGQEGGGEMARRDLGVLLRMDFLREPGGRVRMGRLEAVPVAVVAGGKGIRTVPGETLREEKDFARHLDGVYGTLFGGWTGMEMGRTPLGMRVENP
ncbi:CapA family protein [Anaerotalea alkaliphila]|uniref:CapA family protein n=1 Tax=Anaerotalea alkaliphila TaxID=2662126 RepID=A0A7X5HWX1_9FIRM|nr:CapA family protein [Anaerotalea alkaliphila]NDL68158.1 CapA family protein [Anaerotalea alkaliphila]